MDTNTQKSITRTAGYRYLLFLPNRYLDQEEPWPLVLFLHGAAERGNDLKRIKAHGIPRVVEERKDLPFIAVSPQCPEGEYWIPDMLAVLLDEVEAEHRVDRDRISLTGISMGGYGAWRMAMDYPDRFAALAPICGGGDPDEVCRIKHLPVWAFHGARDRVVPLSESEEMVNALRSCGGTVRFTVYPDAGHDAWTVTYNNPELYAWLLQHRRQAVFSNE
ncbi:MAG: prolyl oligopeptidase family serine peptidase [Nitrospirota bacterium]